MPLLIVHVKLRWRSLTKGVPYPANIDYIISFLRAFILLGLKIDIVYFVYSSSYVALPLKFCPCESDLSASFIDSHHPALDPRTLIEC